MKIVHETIIRPELGREIEVAVLLDQLGAAYAAETGYVEGYTLDGLEEGRLLARVSVWNSKEAADHATKLERVMDLRVQLESVADRGIGEALLDIVTERLADPRQAVTA